MLVAPPPPRRWLRVASAVTNAARAATSARHGWFVGSASVAVLQPPSYACGHQRCDHCPTAHATRAFSALRFLRPVKPTGARESIEPPPPLPDAQIVRVGDDCALEYVDLVPAEAQRDATLVLLHGAPGTYHDFRYLIPHLQQQMPSVRIVGLNFPGFGGSTVDDSRYFELLNAQRAARLTLHALQQLIGGSESVYLVGHSFGGHAALNLAALNLRASSSSDGEPRPLKVQGLVLLASAGTRPHLAVRPREAALAVRALESSPRAVHTALSWAIKAFYTRVLRFPSAFPPSHFVSGVMRAGTTDFGALRDQVAELRRARVASFSAWASDDEFMEDAIPTALAAALGSQRRLAFARAGHNLQKTRAPALAAEIAAWIQQTPAHRDGVAVESRP